MSEIKVEYSQNGLMRVAEIAGRTASVTQFAELDDSNEKVVMQGVKLDWSPAPFNPTTDDAKLYIAALTKAVEIAELWEKDAGKPYKEVLITNTEEIK